MGVRQFVGKGAVVGAIGVLSVVVGGLGVATAANGGSLVLGHSNSATKTTTLKDKRGTPLALVGKASKPPLKVNSSKQVAHLNASLVGGLSAPQLVTTGSGGQTRVDSATPITNSPVLVAKTATLHRGTYYISASGLIFETSDGGFCYVATPTGSALQYGGVDAASSYVQATETVAVKVTSPTSYGEYCYTVDATGEMYNAGIFAIRIGHATTVAEPSLHGAASRAAAPGR